MMENTASCLQSPEVAGRWSYTNARYNDSAYKYTILPLDKSQEGGKISFKVFCVQSDDQDDDESAIYRRIGMGRGVLTQPAQDQPSALLLQLVMGKIAPGERMDYDGLALEMWQGNTQNLRGTRDTELHKDAAWPERGTNTPQRETDREQDRELDREG